MESVFLFFKESISCITDSFLISKEQLGSVRSFLQERFAHANTIPGTRCFCHFGSDAIGNIKFKIEFQIIQHSVEATD